MSKRISSAFAVTEGKVHLALPENCPYKGARLEWGARNCCQILRRKLLGMTVRMDLEKRFYHFAFSSFQNDSKAGFERKIKKQGMFLCCINLEKNWLLRLA